MSAPLTDKEIARKLATELSYGVESVGNHYYERILSALVQAREQDKKAQLRHDEGTARLAVAAYQARQILESSPHPEPVQVTEEEFPYWAVRDPDGHLVHTFLSTEPADVSTEWIKTEQAMNLIYNAGRVIRGEQLKCTPSWEAFEAEGYSLVRVKVAEAPSLLRGNEEQKPESL